jgi:hypothetical protein
MPTDINESMIKSILSLTVYQKFCFDVGFSTVLE